jgi:hypothetical protein
MSSIRLTVEAQAQLSFSMVRPLYCRHLRRLRKRRLWRSTTASNLPKAYVDTAVSDPAGEQTHTIGSANAQELVANQLYWTSMRKRVGNASTDRGKIQGQRGHRFPAWCYTTWCVFPDKTLDIIRAWLYPIPATRNWST